jgi:hypothetical protein
MSRVPDPNAITHSASPTCSSGVPESLTAVPAESKAT